jgi:hypothetical protein
VQAPANGQRGRTCAEQGGTVPFGASCNMYCDAGFALSGVQAYCDAATGAMSQGTLLCTGACPRALAACRGGMPSPPAAPLLALLR